MSGWRFLVRKVSRSNVSETFATEIAFTLQAFAKINWTLHILGRRADGYHELCTVFQTVALHDNLTFEPRAGERFELTCNAPDVPSDESNLVYRAAVALREYYGIKRGASIHLEKSIPSAAGLGGGSSDAAVALLGLAHLWQIETNTEELTGIAARLGADVPFFFTGGTALGTGLGTQIKALGDVAQQHLLIVTPNETVMTADAYKSLNAPALTKARSDIILSSSRVNEQFSDSLPYALHNDFEPVVFRLKPEIERARNRLLEAGAQGALLAGSGASVFATFDNREAQARALRALESETGWRLFSCSTLARKDYLAALGSECRAMLKRAPS